MNKQSEIDLLIVNLKFAIFYLNISEGTRNIDYDITKLENAQYRYENVPFTKDDEYKLKILKELKIVVHQSTKEISEKLRIINSEKKHHQKKFIQDEINESNENLINGIGGI
jgi:hypothetical protein